MLLAISLCLFISTVLRADTVEISGGGSLNGIVKRQAEFTVVAVDDEIQVAIPNSRVRRVVESDSLANYRANAEKAGNDAELHYQLAVWCATPGSIPGVSDYYKRFHMQRAIELDPDHPHARASLGYKKQNGKWISTADFWRNRGMISVAGKWELPEAVSLNDAAQSFDVESKKWIKEISRLVGIATKGSSKSAEAIASIKAIKDPLAAGAIAKQLKDSRGNRSQTIVMRRLWITKLGEFKNGVSVRALVEAGIDEPDDNIREAALEELQHYGSSSAVATYLPMLKANDHALVNRAARALSWFPDPELAMSYVDALVTTKTTQGPAGPGMNVGFGDNGANGMSTGGQPAINKDTKTNPAVYALLREIEPEADFGYDEAKWQAYFASKKTSFSGDLRRDK